MKARNLILVRLLSEGYDVLMSDLDAIWVRNPFTMINEHVNTSDVIGSRGIFPGHAAEKWGGSTVCMGFVYIKASRHTVELWNGINRLIARSSGQSDQIHEFVAADVSFEVQYETDVLG